MVERTVDAKDLKAAVARCGATILRDKVSFGRFVYLRADPKELFLASTNFQGMTVATVSAKEQDGAGELCIPFEQFRDVVMLLDGKVVIGINQDKKRLTINNGQVEMSGDDGDQFPEIPSMPEPILAIDDVAGFRKAIGRVRSASHATEDHLNGVVVISTPDGVELIAADKILIAIDRTIKSTILSWHPSLKLFVPDMSMDIVASFNAERIEVAIDEERGRLFLRGNNSYIMVRTANFNFPLEVVVGNIPVSEVSVTVDSKEFEKAYKLASLFGDSLKDNEAVRITLEWTATAMTVSSFRRRKGAQGAQTTIPATANGLGRIIVDAAKTKNLKDLVAAPTLTIGVMANEKKPYLMTSEALPGYISFISPINVSE